MKTRKKLLMILCLVTGMFWSASSIQAQVSDADKLYEEGVYQMEAAGDFDKAILLFNRVVKEFPANKTVAAKALLKAGICYERLGSEKASVAYNQIISQYSDQASLVSQARERLAALQKVEPVGLTMTRLVPPEVYLECQTLSPDATKVAGIDFTNGQNLAVYDRNAGKLKMLTNYDWSEKSFNTYTPVWSPDGREIVHYATGWGDPKEEFVQLRITSLEGQSSVLFRNTTGSGVAPCDWMPDKSAVLAAVGNKDGIYNLEFIFTEDGTRRDLCPLQKKYRSSDLPLAEASRIADISPDGKMVVFSDGPNDAKSDIFIIPINGGSKLVLTDHPADDREPRWSPDGQHIVFLSTRHGSLALWGLDIRNGKAEGSPYLILEGMEDQELSSWTNMGLCTRTIASISDVYTLEMDPQTQMPVGKPRVLESQAFGKSFAPLFSPDGKYLSYRSYIDGEEPGCMMIKAITSGETKINKYDYMVPPVSGSLQWIPGNSWIGMIYCDKDNNLYLNQLDPVEGKWKSRQIPTGDYTGGRLLSIAWSSDGGKFFYPSRDEGLRDIGIIGHDLETGREHYIFRYTKEDLVEWSWWNLRASRDYKKLSFNWNNKIGILDIDSGDLQEIEYGDEQKLLAPTWSPDGRFLLAKGPHDEGDDFNELYIISIEDGSYRSLDISQYLPRGARIMISHDWSPDGKTIAFDTRTWKSEANLIQNVIPTK